MHGVPFQIALYRPRIEGLFSRIERWTAADTGISHWRTITRDNVTTLYGADPASTIANPADPTQIFAWQICRTWDDHGNAALYSYSAEDGAGIDLVAAHEANRTRGPRRAELPQYRPVREPPALRPRLGRAAGDSAPRGLDVLRGPRLRRPLRHAAGPATRPALAGAPRPVLHPSRRIRDPDLPAGAAVPVLQQLPGRADGRPGLPRPLPRPDLLRPASPRRSPQPGLHLPHLDHPDRLPARRRGVRDPVDAAARVRLQPAANPARRPDHGPRQPGQPPGRAEWQPTSGPIWTARACPGS